jgi:signal transduction histidine kinase/nitrate/nitrite-specific signal transduction histidine kinase
MRLSVTKPLGQTFLKYSLRARLTLAFLLVALLPLGLLAFLNNRTARSSLTAAANQALFAAASQTATNVEAFINANLDAIAAEAQAPLLVSYLNLPAAQRADSPLAKEVLTLLLGFKNKQSRNSGNSTPGRYTFIHSYTLLDPKGRVLVDTARTTTEPDRATRPYYKQALVRRQPYMAPLEFSPLGEASLYFSMVILNEDQRPAGVLLVRYNALILQNIIAQSNGLAGERSFGALLDENHAYLAHGNDPALLFRTATLLAPEEYANLRAAGRLPERSPTEQSTNQPELASGLTNIATTPFFAVPAGGGEQHQVAVNKLTSQPWLVAFFQPQEVFLTPAGEQTRITLVLALAVAGLLLVVTVSLTRRLTAPVTALVHGAQRIAQGQLDQAVPVHGYDELGVLARAFNSMQAELHQSYQGLQKRVAELTTLQQISTSLSGLLEQPDIFKVVASGVQSLLGVQAVRIFSPLDEQAQLALVAEGEHNVAATALEQQQASDQAALVAQTGTLSLVEPVSLAPNQPPLTLVTLPIKRGEQLQAILQVAYQAPQRLSEDELGLLSVLAEQVSLALENARLYQETQAALQRTSDLYAAAQAIASAISIKEICQKLVGHFNDLVQADNTMIILVDHKQHQVSLTASYTNPDQPIQITYEELQAGIAGRVMRTNQPVLSEHADDGIEPEATKKRRKTEGTGAIIVVPLAIKGEVIGIVTAINRVDQRVFTRRDVDALMMLATHAATAIDNTRLDEATATWARTLEVQVVERTREVERRATQIATSAQVAQVASGLLDPDELISQVVELLQERFGFYYVGLFLLDESGQYAVLRQASGQAGRVLKSLGYRLPVEESSMVGWVCVHKQARLALDAGNDPVHFVNPLLPETHSEVALPMRLGERVLGVLDVHSRQAAAFDESDVTILQSMSDHVAVALENARLFQQTQATLKQTEELYEATLVITAATNIREICRRLQKYCHDLVQADQISIYLVDTERQQLQLSMHYGPPPREAPTTYAAYAAGSSGQVLRAGQPLLLVSAPGKPELISPVIADSDHPGRGTSIIAPLRVKGQTIGTITAASRDRGHHFTQQDVDLLMTLATNAATAIENIHLLEETLAARDAAEAANRAKNTFLANMSHELRTPLNAIIGYTEMLQEEANELGASVMIPDLERIRTSGQLLLAIISDILDLSKIEAGKLELAHSPFDLRACLAEVLSLVGPKAAEKELVLDAHIAPTTPTTLIGDAARIRQILTNLISNAVKFTSAGNIFVSVTSQALDGAEFKVVQEADARLSTDTQPARPASPVEPPEHPQPTLVHTPVGALSHAASPHLSSISSHPDPHPTALGNLHSTLAPRYQIHFSIRDTGIGIPADRLDRLFQPFSQVDDSSTRRYGGTGLGLVISKRLCEMLGGTMWVESEPERGSIFHFTIIAESAPTPES